MESGFTAFNKRKMCFFTNQEMLFGGTRDINTFPSAVKMGGRNMIYDECLIMGWPTKEGEMKNGSKKVNENFPKKMHCIDDPSLLIVGGFVGSKSQGGSSSRFGEIFSIWDVIRHFLPSRNCKVECQRPYPLKECSVRNFTPGVHKRNMPSRVTPMNKSYAEVTKSGIISDTNQKELKEPQVLKLAPSLKMTSAIINSLKPILNGLPPSMEGKHYKGSRVSDSRVNSISSDSDSSELISGTMLKKCRNLSESSIDSDDSYIVFENDSDGSSSQENYSGDDSSDDEGKGVDGCNIFFPQSSENVIVQPSGSPLESLLNKCCFLSKEIESKKKSCKKVSFAPGKDLVKVRKLRVWNLAHRLARKGEWEELARDTARFMERIRRSEAILSPIFKPDHRDKIFKERFMSFHY